MDADDVKDQVAAVFSMVAPDYDGSGVDFFGQFARTLVHRLDPDPEWHILDVGAGRGAVVFALLDRIGPAARITAVDLAPGMVDLLRADLAARGIAGIDVRLADAEHLDLPDAGVDAVTASMVLFFLPDVAAGLAELRRVLRAQGVLAFSVFGPSDPRWQPVYEAFLPFLPAGGRGDLSRPRHPALLSASTISATLLEAGFHNVGCEQTTHDIRFASVEQWHTWSWSVGLRGTWLTIPAERRQIARAAILDEVRKLQDPDGGLVERFAVEYVTAQR
jgi:ubiquinone/menaquinone biosynthesis C-methylase UbiE